MKIDPTIEQNKKIIEQGESVIKLLTEIRDEKREERRVDKFHRVFSGVTGALVLCVAAAAFALDIFQVQDFSTIKTRAIEAWGRL